MQKPSLSSEMAVMLSIHELGGQHFVYHIYYLKPKVRCMCSCHLTHSPTPNHQFHESPNNYFNQILFTFFFNSSKPVLTFNWEIFCWLTNEEYIFSAKSKHKKTDSWYLVKKIFGDPQNFGGSDPTNELLIKVFGFRFSLI